MQDEDDNDEGKEDREEEWGRNGIREIEKWEEENEERW